MLYNVLGRLFTAEAQRTLRGANFVCRETTTNKKVPPSGRKTGRLSSSRSLYSEYTEGACSPGGDSAPVTRYKIIYHEVHEDNEVFYNLISICAHCALRGDILSRMLCPSEFRDGFRAAVFAQSPSPDWAKMKFSALSASLRLNLSAVK